MARNFDILKRFLIRSIPFGVCGILLSRITEGSPKPENTTHLWFVLPAFLIFLLFLAAMLSLGAFFRTRLFLKYSPLNSGAENGCVDLALGSVFLYCLAYVLTVFGWFSSEASIFSWILLALFFGLGSAWVKPTRWFDFAKNRFGKVLLAIPLLIIFLRVLEGLQLSPQGDAYVAYLPAPRLWADQGSFLSFLHFPQFFLTTSWESLFAWGNALMHLRGGAGLDLSQYFGQWCAGGIALLGILLATLAICKRVSEKFPVSEIYFPIVAVSAMQIPTLRWTANLAKNDMGVAFWGLSAFYFTLFLVPISPWLAFLGGVIGGAAVIGKLPLAFFAMCLAGYTLLFSPKRFLWFALGGVIGSFPVFFRNYWLTKDPVFPWLPNVFPTEFLSQGQIHSALYPTSKGFHWENFGTYLLEIQNQLPLALLLILVFVLVKNRASLLKLLSIPVLATFLFTFAFRPSTEIRYQNADLVMLAIFSTYFGFQLLTILPRKFRQFSSSLFTVAIIATANITTFSLFQIGSDKFSPVSKSLNLMAGGEGKLWIRKNLKPDDSILMIGDSYLYYLVDYNIREIHQTLDLDDALSSHNANSFFKTLLASSYQYASIETDDAYLDLLPQVRALNSEFEKHDLSCRIFSSPREQIWNLNCLRAQSRS